MSEEQLIKLIYENNNIGLIIHEKPDGDTIASCVALKLALDQIGKDSDIICKDVIPQTFSFLPCLDCIKNEINSVKYTLLITVDCGNLNRTGFKNKILTFVGQKKLINIDHHPKNDLHRLATLNIIDYNASATVEIVETIIKAMGLKIDKNIATCLFTGLYTDTGGFKHPNTMQRAFNRAGVWLSYGAKFSQIIDNIANHRSITFLKLLGIACSRLKINQKYKIATSAITLDDLATTNAKTEEINGIINYLINLPDIKIAMLFEQIDKETIRVVLRSNNSACDLKMFAGYFDGRGQRNASGFKIHGQILCTDDSWLIRYL